MALMRWRPMRDLVDIQEEINRMFHDFAGPMEGETRLPRVFPPIDMVENKDSFIIKAELPSLRKEDVKVSLQNNVLTISGEKKQEERGETYHRMERLTGTFHRTIELPVAVKADYIKAEFKDGVLTIDLPKVEEAKPKEISINVN